MIISDLNYLEITSREILGGAVVNINRNFNLSKVVKVDIQVNETFNKMVVANLQSVNKNLAEVYRITF